MKKETNTCVWIGDGEMCHQPIILDKSYCERHHNRMYDTMPAEMADYIIDKETQGIKSTCPIP
jgi:hypothetical protein